MLKKGVFCGFLGLVINILAAQFAIKEREVYLAGGIFYKKLGKSVEVESRKGIIYE